VRGKYEFKQSIGKGRFSRVWLVENRLTKQPYAMKIAKGNEGREIFLSELSVLSRIRHPNIVQLIETFETAKRFYMVLQLATGGDLFDRVLCQPQGYFTEQNAARIMKMVLDGVQYLHRLGITHRDLKPDNLLFYHPGPDSDILISDFVVAHVCKGGGNHLMHTVCGAPEYISPELLSKKPYTSAVDLWALGVVAYILLSGTFPFADDSDSNRPNIKLFKLILKGSFSYEDKVWQGVGDVAKDFINKLLVVDPGKRMTATDALQHPWIKSNGSRDSSHEELSTSPSANSDSSSEKSTSGRRRKIRRKDARKQLDPELSKLKQRILVHHKPLN